MLPFKFNIQDQSAKRQAHFMSDRIIKQQHKEQYFNRQQQKLFDILTGKIKYNTNYFQQDDLKPHLILKVKVPNIEYISRDDFIEMSKYVSVPSRQLQKTFQKAQKKIIDEMNQNKQNTDTSNLKIRLQKALVPTHLVIKKTKLINQYDEEQPLQMQSIYKHNGTLDCFTLQYNTIVYLLQKVCGFSIKSFLLYDQHQENKQIFMFLTLKSQNFVNLAKKYRIKKEIDYSFIDFFMNDPCLSDERPIKYSSSIKTDKTLINQFKSINRYFKVGNSSHQITQIVDQIELSDVQKDRFRDYMQDLEYVYEYQKYKIRNIITNQQKAYIYEYNRNKINKGCQKLYALIKKRRQFFQINKEILLKYGYKYYLQPLVYQQFALLDSKQMSFFDKLYSLLLYKPQVVNEKGDLDLFLNMQKIKLAYLNIKHNFKINYLKKIGFQFIALTNDYQKFGNGIDSSGGINGKNLQSQWKTLFLSIDTVRNYFGDSIAFQILIKARLLNYFVIIVPPFLGLYISQFVYGEDSYIFTTFLQTLIYAVSFQCFLLFWRQEEQEFITNYTDEKSSTIFLSDYRGPYVRNIVTDELNQFNQGSSLVNGIKNIICAIILAILLVIMGTVFYGCRQLLQATNEPLQSFSISAISLSHIISYLIFFFIADLLALIATDRIIRLMVRLQNPPTDEDENQWIETLTFFYLFGLELIAPFFFLIIEPFTDTSCFANSCVDEIEFYVYSRIIITFLISITRLVYVFVFNYMKEGKKKVHQQFYQDKLGNLLHNGLKESKKIDYSPSNNQTIVVLISFSIYTNVAPLISTLALIALLIFAIKNRLVLLYQARRPINRSQKIIQFTLTARSIFYVGLFCQAWIAIFSLQFVQKHLQSAVTAISKKITYQGLFLIKFFLLIGFMLVLIIIARGVQALVKGISSNALFNRKDNKFKEYMQSRGKLKAQLKKPYQPAPIKSIFRTFNPKKLNIQLVQEQLYAHCNELQTTFARPQNEHATKEMSSLINLTVGKINR